MSWYMDHRLFSTISTKHMPTGLGMWTTAYFGSSIRVEIQNEYSI